MNKARLFLNGPPTKLPIWEDSLPIFCTDGAYHTLINCLPAKQSIRAVIGDFDSANAGLTPIPDALRVYRPDQNYTDFEKALVYLQQQGFTDLDVYFASGGEMDHFLCNLSVAKKFYPQMQLHFSDDYADYFLLATTESSPKSPHVIHLENVADKIVSILPFPQACISTQGLFYDVEHFVMALGAATSCRNVGKTANAQITVHQGMVAIFVAKTLNPHRFTP